MVWLAGSRPTSCVTAKVDVFSQTGISITGSAFTSANWKPGTVLSINSCPPKNRSSWLSITVSATSSAFGPDLVLYDITSTYFEGAGPANFAKHGYSRDGKPQNVQVIVGVVMVAGWPIAHHVGAGNTVDHDTVQEVIRDLHQRFRFKRVVFVGDRGMVTDKNLSDLTADKHGYLVGLKRRRNPQIEQWLAAVDELKCSQVPR